MISEPGIKICYKFQTGGTSHISISAYLLKVMDTQKQMEVCSQLDISSKAIRKWPDEIMWGQELPLEKKELKRLPLIRSSHLISLGNKMADETHGKP